MATAVRIPCLTPRCPRPATRRGRCAEHHREYDRTPYRTAQRRFYASSEWRLTRARILARDPICRDESGCTARSTDVDHIVTKRNGGSDDDSNLRGMCHSHHSARTARDESW